MLKKINKENDSIFSWIKNESFSNSQILNTYSTIEQKKKISPFINILNKIKANKTISSKQNQIKNILTKKLDKKNDLSFLQKNILNSDTNREIIKVNKSINPNKKIKLRNTKEASNQRKSNLSNNHKLKLKLLYNQFKINNNFKNNFKKYIKLNSSLKRMESLGANRKTITTNIIFNPIISNNIIFLILFQQIQI